MIEEAGIKIDVEPTKKISKEMLVFYNPVMKFNRDISILVLKVFPCKKIALPLSATGIRGIRILKELNNFNIVFFNDYSAEAVKLIKHNLKLNGITKKFEITNQDANLFLLNDGFDYIDIDPFGSPNPFLDSSLKAISRKGILAVTATDTAPLAGTYPKACLRKYWASPLRNEYMHETGLRILIRKCQLIGMQYEKALIPVLSYYKDHYYRIFFQVIKGKKRCDEIVLQHGLLNNSGPMFLGSLYDKKLIKNMIKLCKDEKLKTFLKIIEKEIDVIGFYNLNMFGKELKLKRLPKMETLIEAIKKENYLASRTHFTGEGFKTNMPKKDLIKLLKQLVSH